MAGGSTLTRDEVRSRPRRPVDVVRRHPLGTYLTLAFAWSWAWWVPLALSGGGGSHVPGLLGPAVAGLVTTALLGRDELRGLLQRTTRWRVSPRLYAVAVAPLAVAALAVGVTALLGEGLPSWAELAAFPGLPQLAWPVVLALVLVANGFGEEVGWRGLLWPRLRRRHGAVRAAAMVTVPWALWHLPLFWLDTGLGDLRGATIAGWLVGLAAGSLVLGWLSERADSVVVAALFHTAMNMGSATAGTAGLPAAVVSAAVIVAATVILRHRTAAFPPDRDRAPGAPRRAR